LAKQIIEECHPTVIWHWEGMATEVAWTIIFNGFSTISLIATIWKVGAE